MNRFVNINDYTILNLDNVRSVDIDWTRNAIVFDLIGGKTYRADLVEAVDVEYWFDLIWKTLTGKSDCREWILPTPLEEI